MAKEKKNSKRWGKWTEEKVRELREHYPNDSWDELIDRFRMSKQSIIKAACEFGVRRENTKFSTYSKEEDELIISYYNQGFSDEEISKLMPHRTPNSINTRRSKIGATKPMLWSTEEDDVLKEFYSKMPVVELMQYLPGRSRNAIVLHAEYIGLSQTGYRNYEYYTQEDYEYIRNHYLEMSDEEIGNILNHSRDSIKNQRNKMSLHRIDKGRINYESFDVYFRRHNKDWKLNSMRNCNYKCVITGGRFDDIHHLYSQDLIIDEVLRRWGYNKNTFDINTLSENDREQFLTDTLDEQSKYPLGVCLCHNVHKQFHDLYGYGNNTPNQFLEFAERFYPSVQLNIA